MWVTFWWIIFLDFCEFFGGFLWANLLWIIFVDFLVDKFCEIFQDIRFTKWSTIINSQKIHNFFYSHLLSLIFHLSNNWKFQHFNHASMSNFWTCFLKASLNNYDKLNKLIIWWSKSYDLFCAVKFPFIDCSWNLIQCPSINS